VNLTKWARGQGIHPRTACRWFREGTFPVPAVRVNSRSVLVAPDAAGSRDGGGLGLCARVASHDQKADLDRPVARVQAEVGSGVNGARSRVRRLLAEPLARVVVVERRGRLVR
jgi:putative resolvase